jgi:hypothetical protein
MVVGHKKFQWNPINNHAVQSQNCQTMYTESQIYTKKLLFVDEPQKFLQNHQFLFQPNQILKK